MDLIYTDENRVEQGVLSAYQLDMSFGESENDFELTQNKDQPLPFGAFVYSEGTEYGGIIDGVKTSTNSQVLTYFGRTWHGILNSKIIEPPEGSDYLIVSGDANVVLKSLIHTLGLDDIFTVSAEISGITINNYQFDRYVKAYEGINKLMRARNAKLKMRWENNSVMLCASPRVISSGDCLDEYSATISVEKHANKVNHLICLGSGELANRLVCHWYCDASGIITGGKHYTGLDEITEIYDDSGADTIEKLQSAGYNYFLKLLKTDVFDVDINDDVLTDYDINDEIVAFESKTNTKTSERVVQKIVRIQNGVVRTEYKTGGQT